MYDILCMPPRIKCPNCKQNEWLKSPRLGYIPQFDRDEKGNCVADVSNGVDLSIWRCNNCMYVMTFWEPDYSETQRHKDVNLSTEL